MHILPKITNLNPLVLRLSPNSCCCTEDPYLLFLQAHTFWKYSHKCHMVCLNELFLFFFSSAPPSMQYASTWQFSPMASTIDAPVKTRTGKGKTSNQLGGGVISLSHIQLKGLKLQWEHGNGRIYGKNNGTIPAGLMWRYPPGLRNLKK